MSDPTQFIVFSQAIIHRILKHQGLIGEGRSPHGADRCTLHSYKDSSDRQYVMQLWQAVQMDQIGNKLSSIAAFSHGCYLPNIVRPAFISTRKQKSGFDLAVFYDTTGLGDLSLKRLINNKRTNQEKFEVDEITSFFWQVSDFLLLSVRKYSEYLDLRPSSFICSMQGFKGYNFFLTNFSPSVQHSSYHNPKDSYYSGEKTVEAETRAAMFTFGMVLLEMASLLPPTELYDENGSISDKALLKRVEGVTLTNDQMIAKAIRQLLQIDEHKRLTPQGIFKNQEWLKLRKVIYEPSKKDFHPEKYQNFEGIIEYETNTAIGEALDKNLCMCRGTFQKGVFEGLGVREAGDSLELGVFVAGQLTEGQKIKKNSHIDSGKFKQGQIVSGMRVALNVKQSNKEEKTLVGFEGSFEGGQPNSGKFIYSDGSESQSL